MREKRAEVTGSLETLSLSLSRNNILDNNFRKKTQIN